jgi:hypothetical protein
MSQVFAHKPAKLKPRYNKGARFIHSFVGLLLFFVASLAHAQLVAVDDSFSVPFGEPLVVETFGVLENDILNDESAGENGATAELLTGVTNGTLTCPGVGPGLCADGSFTYTSGTGFSVTDSFTYRAVFGPDSMPATVTLSACTDEGAQIFSCWTEPSYRAKLEELGYRTFLEGFEGHAWDSVRSPDSAPEIISQGIAWTSNYPGRNPITTGSGPAYTGQWGAFDPLHGYATGTPTACDIDNPDPLCLYHDGLSGSIQLGSDPLHSTLHGVGGYITGTYGANIAIILDGASDVNQPGYIVMGKIGSGHQFFGVIDATASGFTEFKIQEEDGKIGQALYIWSDDFTIATSADAAPNIIFGDGFESL